MNIDDNINIVDKLIYQIVEKERQRALNNKTLSIKIKMEKKK